MVSCLFSTGGGLGQLERTLVAQGDTHQRVERTSMGSYHGAWPALLTPVTSSGHVNIEVLRQLVEHLVRKAIGGLYLCGNTGEGLWMSLDERKQVVETVADQLEGRVPFIVHVGSVSTRDAIALARHASEFGAVGVSSILPPLVSGLEAVYLHFRAIADAVPTLQFYPYLYGGQADAVTLMRGLLERIPNIGGAKYTGPNMFELWQLSELEDDNWTIFSGMDEQCLFAAMSGAPANIGSTLNLMPGVYREMRTRYEAGDFDTALELQIKTNRVTRVLLAFGFPGALREAMGMLGFDCGAPRLPHPPLREDHRSALREALLSAGIEDLAAL